jgi:hypothetical protein
VTFTGIGITRAGGLRRRAAGPAAAAATSTSGAPLSLAAALQRGVTITVGAGVYPPLELLPEDSGTAEFPVVWRAAASNGSAIISGGVRIPNSLFKPWGGHPGVLTADISSFGLEFGTMGTCARDSDPISVREITSGCINCTAYTWMGLNQPWASLSLSADIHLNVLNNSI